MENKQITTKDFFNKDSVKAKFNELMGKRSTSFITTILQTVANNEMLAKAEPSSIFHAACVAATLGLPVNANLGFAYILPYNDKKNNRQLAQFQMGYKGFIQLAQRTGQFKRISASAIYQGQITSNDPLKGYEFDFSVAPIGEPIGYAGYFSLLSGYEATLYLDINEINTHAKKYSQSFKSGFGIWKDNFDAMAKKTVLKLLLSKYAPLSVEAQTAVQLDQAIIKSEDLTDFEYIDNTKIEASDKADEKRTNILLEAIEQAKTPIELHKIESELNNETLITAYNAKEKSF